MIDVIASFFRSVNSRLTGEDRWIIHKCLKIFYGFSGILFQLKVGSKNEFIVIDNFDRDIKLKINKSWVMGFSIYWTGFHEFHEFLFLHRFLKPEMVVVDVGANMGEYSVFMAKRVLHGKVIAIEPLPKMYALLEENLSLNHFTNVVVLKFGLSDTEEMLTINELEDSHEGLSTFYPGNKTIRAKIEVPLRTMDGEFEKFGASRIDFIKMDIEGGELSALRGSKKAIERFRPVIMVEINEVTYQAAGYSAADVFDYFSALEYKPFVITKQGDLVPMNDRPTFANIVFKPA